MPRIASALVLSNPPLRPVFDTFLNPVVWVQILGFGFIFFVGFILRKKKNQPKLGWVFFSSWVGFKFWTQFSTQKKTQPKLGWVFFPVGLGLNFEPKFWTQLQKNEPKPLILNPNPKFWTQPCAVWVKLDPNCTPCAVSTSKLHNLCSLGLVSTKLDPNCTGGCAVLSKLDLNCTGGGVQFESSFGRNCTQTRPKLHRQVCSFV